MRLRQLLKNFLLLFSTLAVFLLLLELTLRTANLFGARLSYSKPDSILAYRFAPNAEYYYYKENPKPITGRFNNFGWNWIRRLSE
jgi:hypothetical protein